MNRANHLVNIIFAMVALFANFSAAMEIRKACEARLVTMDNNTPLAWTVDFIIDGEVVELLFKKKKRRLKSAVLRIDKKNFPNGISAYDQDRITLHKNCYKTCTELGLGTPSPITITLYLKKWLKRGTCDIPNLYTGAITNRDDIIGTFADFNCLTEIVKCASAKETLPTLPDGFWCLQDFEPPSQKFFLAMQSKKIELKRFIRGSKKGNRPHLIARIKGRGYRWPQSLDGSDWLKREVDSQCAISLLEALKFIAHMRGFKLKNYVEKPAKQTKLQSDGPILNRKKIDKFDITEKSCDMIPALSPKILRAGDDETDITDRDWDGLLLSVDPRNPLDGDGMHDEDELHVE